MSLIRLACEWRILTPVKHPVRHFKEDITDERGGGGIYIEGGKSLCFKKKIVVVCCCLFSIDDIIMMFFITETREVFRNLQ
jgi:hypothetical protein